MPDWFDPEAIESEKMDADIEMAQLQDRARHDAYLRSIGKCRHGWTGPKVVGQKTPFICFDCKFEFKDEAERDRIVEEKR